jgi:hypothetical protein
VLVARARRAMLGRASGAAGLRWGDHPASSARRVVSAQLPLRHDHCTHDWLGLGLRLDHMGLVVEGQAEPELSTSDQFRIGARFERSPVVG